MLTIEQILHNIALDWEIKKADEEHAAYIAEMDEKRERYMREHPDDPYAHLTYLAIKSKRTVIGMRYVD
jgi:hypothetical protein